MHIFIIMLEAKANK